MLPNGPMRLMGLMEGSVRVNCNTPLDEHKGHEVDLGRIRLSRMRGAGGNVQ